MNVRIVNDGDRIDKLVISRHEQAEWIEMDELIQTDRCTGGFGSTGIN